MRLPPGTSRLLVVPLLLLPIALVVIGTLQYRWLGRVSEAERQRMHGTLEFGAENLAAEIATLMQSVFHAFLGIENADPVPLLEDWQRRAEHADVVAAVYVADREGDSWSVRRIDPRTRELVPAMLPPTLAPLGHRLATLPRRGPRERWPGPMFGAIPALLIVQTPDLDDPPPPVPAQPRRVLLVQLDRDALQSFLAERAQRVLPKDVDIELVANGTMLYRSSPTGIGTADVTHAFRAIAPRRDRPPPPRSAPPPPHAEDLWQLRVRHRDGGLDAIVAAAHRRNLAVASLVLLLLAAASALLVALLRRGERLRVQQAQFVAAMSHELNTPLAVLRVASENLNDGIVQDPEKVSRYVRTIARETANLSEMVSHVLELAGMNSGVKVIGRDPVHIDAVVQEAVAQSRSMIDASAIAIEVDVDRGLPAVRGDARALTRAVQNLVTNALRHAGGGKWVGVRATRDDGFVRVVVEDRGPGIDAADARQLFEPFYRGRGSGNVRGTGLGLTIVKQIVDEHGGSVTIERGRDAGAAFVIRLPAEFES